VKADYIPAAELAQVDGRTILQVSRFPASISGNDMELYLAELAKHGNRMKAAEVARISLREIARLRRHNEDFAEEERVAYEAGAAFLESVAHTLATVGISTPTKFGDKTEYPANPLLQMLLKASDPERFKERSEVTNKTVGLPASTYSDADKRAVAQHLLKMIRGTAGEDDHDVEDLA